MAPGAGRRRRLFRRHRGGLTGRALTLGVIVVLLAVVLASPLQRFLQQRNSVAAAERQRQTSSVRVAQLQAQLRQWQDPSYVERQARARLQYARPGDTVYVVIDPKSRTGDASGQQTVPTAADAGKGSWQSAAWTTLQVADRAP